MTKMDPVDMVLEYGPDGNVQKGNKCAVYELDSAYVKLVEDFQPHHADAYFEALNSTGISYPSTQVWKEEIPVYDIGDTTVVEQEKVQTAMEEIVEHPERYVSQIRELGLKAASAKMKIDIGLDNLAIIDGELGILDVNDQEAIWLDESLSLHLMGSYLLNSVKKAEREHDLYAPELKQLGKNWKGAV